MSNFTRRAVATDHRYIIWDPRDGEPQTGDDGEIISAGVMGVLEPKSVYITVYPNYRDDRLPNTLEVGAFSVAEFSLSGTRGVYRIYRVR
jgi:hypothetical protein